MLSLLALLAMVAFVASRGMMPQDNQPAELSYTEFKEEVQAGNVAQVTVAGETIRGQLSQAKARPKGNGKSKYFQTVRPPFEDQKLMPLLEEHGVQVTAKPQDQGAWPAIFVSFLPWLIILGVFLYVSYRLRKGAQQMGGGPTMLPGMGQSGAKQYKTEDVDTRFDDVAGLDNAKRDLKEVVSFLRDPSPFRKLGAEVPRGTLLMGPPGTGKTLLARAVAGEASVPFFSISGSEFIQLFVGVGASRVRELFKEAKQAAPAIVFIDEIDAIGRARGAGLGGGHDEREQTLNQILSELDGFEPHETVMVMAGTNRPDVLDKALLRPGRFDRKVLLDLPRKEARLAILQVHASKITLHEDVRLEDLAHATPGFAGADLKNLLNEAAMLAARDKTDRVARRHLDEALDKVRMGDQREGGLSDEERELAAYHESGHALLGTLLPHADKVRKVTILPRGQALGATEQVPDEERHYVTRRQLVDRITVALGGRVAVAHQFGDQTSGAGNDLEKATQLARKMVSTFGMSQRLGPAAFKYGEEHVFLGRELNAEQRNFSDKTASIIDEEIQSLLNDCEKRATELLEQHKEALGALAQKLLDQETVSAEEIQEIARAQRAA